MRRIRHSHLGLPSTWSCRLGCSNLAVRRPESIQKWTLQSHVPQGSQLYLFCVEYIPSWLLYFLVLKYYHGDSPGLWSNTFHCLFLFICQLWSGHHQKNHANNRYSSLLRELTPSVLRRCQASASVPIHHLCHLQDTVKTLSLRLDIKHRFPSPFTPFGSLIPIRNSSRA